MNGLCLSICLSLSVQLQAEAESPSIRLAVLKSEWQEAWVTLRTMHAKVKRFHYDSVFRYVKGSEGTVAFEVDGRCKLALSPMRSHESKTVIRGVEYVREGGEPLTIAWTDDEVVRIEPDRRVYRRYSIADCQKAKDELKSQGVRDIEPVQGGILIETIVNGGNVLQAFSSMFMGLVAMIASPADFVPILFSDPATIEAAGFELTATKQHPRGLTAIPTTAATKRQFDRIDILLGDEGLPCATNMIPPSGTHNVVHVLTEMRINDLSPAAEAEFVPALDGQRLEEWPQ